jgi:hypothetical protein
VDGWEAGWGADIFCWVQEWSAYEEGNSEPAEGSSSHEANKNFVGIWVTVFLLELKIYIIKGIEVFATLGFLTINVDKTY